MGEAKRRKQASSAGQPWPSDATGYREQIELHLLPPIATIDTTRIRDLTGDESFPLGKQVSLNAFRAVVGGREFHVGFCLGDGERFSGIGLAVIDRLLAEEGDAPVFVVPIIDQEVAWDIVLRHLSTFAGKILMFAFANSTVYDAGTAEIYYAREIAVFRDGERMRRLTEEDRRRVKAQAAAIKGKPAPLPKFYQMPGVDRHEQPWIFELKASNGKVLRLTAWNGRRNFIHECPADIIKPHRSSQIERGPGMIDGRPLYMPTTGQVRPENDPRVSVAQSTPPIGPLSDRSGLKAAAGRKRIARRAISSHPQPTERVPHGESRNKRRGFKIAAALACASSPCTFRSGPGIGKIGIISIRVWSVVPKALYSSRDGP